MTTAQAMVERRQQAVGIRRQVNPDNVRLFVDHVIEEPGVLMRETVMILLPDVRGQQVIQRSDFPAPWQFQRDLQPFGMLAEHRIDDTNERLVTVEQPVPPGQQIAFQPALALMLAEHRIKHPASRCEELVIVDRLSVPLAIGHLEHSAEKIRQCLIRPEYPEVVGVQLHNVLEERAQYKSVLTIDSTG